MPPTKQTPFDITAAKLRGFDDYDALAQWLTEEIHNAEDVRPDLEAKLDYWHRIYEQDRTRGLVRNRPQPDGADLTSPLGTQYVDSLHARTMQTIFGVKPIWTVEGWADSAPKAPFVEEFHQWTAEDERVQSYVDRAIQNSWIDSVGVLEVFEEVDYRPVRQKAWAQIVTEPDELGQPRAVFGEDNRPVLQRDPEGKLVTMPIPAPDAPTPVGMAEVELDRMEPVRTGPGYTVIDYADFLVLPGHARDKREIWGYAKRFHRRYSYLKTKVEDGMYDKDACEALGDANERETTLDDTRRGITVARQDGHTAEKQLYEVAFLRDLDGQGERWWVATVSTTYQKLLRLKYDDLGTQIGFGRFVRFVPLPRKNSIDGLSIIGHKILTLIEEHTALRNMRADRAALAASAPIKVQQGAIWDPDDTPIGAGSVIYCRDMNEVQPMVIPDVPDSVNIWERSIFDASERSMGVTDIASGVTAQQDRTLGERQMQTTYSEVRMGLVVRRLQESLEELAHIRHVILKRTVQSQGQMPMPHSVMVGLEARGQDTASVGESITPDMLDGKFQFKPYGSVETADSSRRRNDFVQLMNALRGAAGMSPMIAAYLQQPSAAKSFLEYVLNLWGYADKQAILGVAGQQAAGTAQMLQDPRVQQLLGMGGGQPGMEPGMPPDMGAPMAPPPGMMA